MEGGSPAASIKWMFSDVVISTSSKYTITDSDNSTQLNINIINTSDAGIYYTVKLLILLDHQLLHAITLDVQGILCIVFV